MFLALPNTQKHPVSSDDKAATVKPAPQKAWQIFHRL